MIFNIDFLSQTHRDFSQLTSITTSFLLQQVIQTPTHFSHSGTPSLIDLAFLSNPITCNTIPPLSNSDHLGLSIVCNISTQFKRPKTPRRLVWCYTLGDFHKACEPLRNIDWDSLLRDDDIDLCWTNKWHNQFLHVMEQCIPRKLLSRRKHLPWINQRLFGQGTHCSESLNQLKMHLFLLNTK